MVIFDYEFTEPGYCRVCLSTQIKDQKYFYCLQEEGNTIEMYRCSDDDWWEPQWVITPKPGAEIIFNLPEDTDDYTKQIIDQWAKLHLIKEQVNENQNTPPTATA